MFASRRIVVIHSTFRREHRAVLAVRKGERSL